MSLFHRRAAASRAISLLFSFERDLARAFPPFFPASLDPKSAVHYNYCRVHQTLRVTPAMEAGLTDHVWTLAELVGLMEAGEKAIIGTTENKRGPYYKRRHDIL